MIVARHMVLLVAAATATAGTAGAQDLPTTQLEDHAQVVRQDMLTRRLLKPRRAGDRALATRAAQARATCGSKARAAANLGPDHPKVRRLYALCARAGY